MVSGSVRRLTTPQTVQQIWASVLYIRHQKQISNTDRIVRYMQRTYEMSQTEAKNHLQNTVKDRLLDRYTYVGSKGSKVGIEQEGFKVPDMTEDNDHGNHDWYCFECHKPGEVITCSDCWRVYHVACLPAESIGNKFTCSICKVMRKKQRIKRKELNRLLSYTVNRLKEKTRELHRLFTTEEEQKYAQFIYLSMDLNTMEAKTKNRKYRYIEQFQADAQTIYHNVLLCYGPGTMAELAKIMIRDCKYDLDEIRQCKDCYNYSNAKPSNWFCKPCRPAHELVYAKQKGFSFWPAKVIKKTAEGYDVRFFGGWHQRAVVAAGSVKPIDTNLRALNIKRTSGFTKACEELRRHQKLLEQQQETDDDDDNDNDNDTTANDMEEEVGKKEDEEEEEPKPKRFKEEQDVISSSNVVSDKPAPTPEDANLVTSSEDNIQTPRIISTVDMGTQTSKKLSHPGRQPHKGTQTDLEVATTSCKCEAKYNKIFNDFKERMENDHREDKDRALKELTEQLQKDFEEDKQQAVARTMANMQREVDRVKRQSEDRVKEQYMEELKKLASKHKSDISQTKKKQWCYNCEEEAMYHCCWNTSYCSIKCQQEHWHREHKRCCRRKR